MFAFSLFLVGLLACVAVVLVVMVTGTLTRSDGTPIRSPFQGYALLGRMLGWAFVIVFAPIIFLLAVVSYLRERFTRPCSLERDAADAAAVFDRPRSPKAQLDAAITKEVQARKARGT